MIKKILIVVFVLMNLYLIYRICHFYNVRYDKARNNKNLPNFEFKNLDNLTFCKDSLKKKTEIILIRNAITVKKN